MTEEEEKLLDKKFGFFYKFEICGHVVKVNHCLVARTLIGTFLVCISLHMIWIVHSELNKD